MNHDDRTRLSLGALSVGVVLLLWYISTAGGNIRPIFLPTPAATGKALWDLLVSGLFFKALLASLGRILVATAIAVVIGGLIGIAMGVSKRIDALLSPITQPLRYLPITALIPLLVLWFGIGETMKIIFLFFGVVFYFIPLVRNAVRTTPQEYIDVARSFGASRMTIVRKVYWPHALPQMFDGLIVINGIGWTYVILAEIINARNGLGYLINIAGRLQRSDEVFAGLFLVAMVAIVSDRILHAVRERFFFW
jgi:ABC-type nitrate/sulfonate/bicarbonate transport system permease component